MRLGGVHYSRGIPKLACHNWANAYASRIAGAGSYYLIEKALERGRRGADFEADAWDDLQALPVQPYTPEYWAELRPPFVGGLDQMDRFLQGVLEAHSTTLSKEVRILILRTQRELAHDRVNYLAVPNLRALNPSGINRNFHGRIKRPLDTMAKLCPGVTAAYGS